ncbi:uncharacterized protein LOC131238994 isoform X2 [Magnolia sinica]|uniref:uncharacterized protein LOC131238994 isoform X2 n=1 Tax=Magnolia sinica TaxID=86752 RepID=UPI002657B4CA|nr:uncharacterized protein LOC131238994 isoform X2 [Magnolia sinica]
MASIVTIPSPLSLSSPFLKTLSKPYKTLTLKDPLSSPKPFLFRKKTKIPTPPSQISSSLSENCSFSVSSAEIPRDFVSGTAFLSSILAALVWILESRRKRPLLLPYRSINRQYYDLKRKTVEVGSWKLSLDVLPSIRESYDHPKVLIDPAFLGIVKSADRVVFGGSVSSNYSGLDPIGINSELSDFSDEEEGDFGGLNGSIDHPTVVTDLTFPRIVNSADRVAFGGSVCSNYSRLDPIGINSEMSDFSDEEEGGFGGLNGSIDHPTVGTDLAFLRIVNSADRMAFGSLVFRNYSGLDTIDINSEPSDFSDGEVGECGGLNASRSGWNPLLLPAVSAACLEIPSSSVIAVSEQVLCFCRRNCLLKGNCKQLFQQLQWQQGLLVQ